MGDDGEEGSEDKVVVPGTSREDYIQSSRFLLFCFSREHLGAMDDFKEKRE